MQFRILGPIEACRDGESLPLGGSKRRALLALLLLHANEIVSSARLAEDLWGEDLPHNAAGALQNHVSRLRKLLGPDVLVTQPGGYSLVIDTAAIDLHRFEQLVAEAESADPIARAALLHEALELWRGPPLADIAEPFAAYESLRLEEARLSTVENRIDADLELGRHAELVGELERLVEDHPLRERLRGQLILALYRCGRQAEALEVYRGTRRVLADELGLEPGPALKELERAILRQDPALIVAPRRTEKRPRRSWRLFAYAAVVFGALAAGSVAIAIATTHGSRAAKHVRPIRVAQPAVTAEPASSHTRQKRVAQPRTSAPKHDTGTAPRVPRHVRRHVPRARTSRHVDGPLPTAAAPSRPHAATKPKTPAAPRRPATKPRWLTISDDFSDATVDRAIWHVINSGTQVDVAQSNGRVEIAIGAGATAGGDYNVIDGHYGTQCKFPSDFDARIDFTLLDWPQANGVFAGLNAFFADSAVGRQSSVKWGENYAAWVIPDNGGIPGANDMSGTIRLARTDGVVSAYVMHKGNWLRVASGRNNATAVIGATAMSNDDDFGHKAVRVAFDNFVVKGKNPICPYG